MRQGAGEEGGQCCEPPEEGSLLYWNVLYRDSGGGYASLHR